MAGRSFKTTVPHTPHSAQLLLRRISHMAEQTSNLTSQSFVTATRTRYCVVAECKSFHPICFRFQIGSVPKHGTYSGASLVNVWPCIVSCGPINAINAYIVPLSMLLQRESAHSTPIVNEMSRSRFFDMFPNVMKMEYKKNATPKMASHEYEKAQHVFSIGWRR